MSKNGGVRLPIVDGLELDEERRRALRPGGTVQGADGRLHRLPRFFWQIDSWDQALTTEVAPSFSLWEFLDVDVREAEIVREYPRYIPCAVGLLAACMALFRRAADTYVHVAANGGYRSPSHALSHGASTHCWGTAVNVYRVGDDWLDDKDTVEQYADLARSVSPLIWVRPWGHSEGEADDHLHLDLGHVLVTPHGAAGELSRAEETEE